MGTKPPKFLNFRSLYFYPSELPYIIKCLNFDPGKTWTHIEFYLENFNKLMWLNRFSLNFVFGFDINSSTRVLTVGYG